MDTYTLDHNHANCHPCMGKTLVVIFASKLVFKRYMVGVQMQTPFEIASAAPIEGNNINSIFFFKSEHCSTFKCNLVAHRM